MWKSLHPLHDIIYIDWEANSMDLQLQSLKQLPCDTVEFKCLTHGIHFLVLDENSLLVSLPLERRVWESLGPPGCCYSWWWWGPCRVSPVAGTRSEHCLFPQRCAACQCSSVWGMQPGDPQYASGSFPQTAAIQWLCQPWCTPPLPTAPTGEKKTQL